MTVEVTITPSDPSALDTIHVRVHGEVPEPATVLILGNAGSGAVGDEGGNVMRSPRFTQGTMPAGTGPATYQLTVTGTDGDFTLSVYEYGDEPVETDPIYHFEDEDYTYPDAGDIAEALEAALDGLAVEVDKDENGVMTISLGGVFSGRQVILLADGAGLTDGDAVLEEVRRSSGPFEFGPLTIPAGDYEIDVLNDEDESLLDDGPIELTVS